MDIVPQSLGITLRDDLREDFGGAILDRTDETEQDTAGDPAPGAIACPRVPFERLLASDLTAAQRACGQTRALRCAPPAGTRVRLLARMMHAATAHVAFCTTAWGEVASP